MNDLHPDGLIQRLAKALREEWLLNHDERCGVKLVDDRHEGECYCPVPEVLLEAEALR